ncbi:MAG: hypothetical protein Q8900_08380, partial [Bacillota bacterium]|nr:hypothetical protein [Bacillota bacterium]
ANLIYLNSSSNKLTDVNVGLNKILTYLDCSTNNISDLDVTKNTALTYLFCESNQLTTLYSNKDTWNNIFYKTQYTDSLHTTTTDTLSITIII